MKRVIISGANGFIGSALVKYLISKNIEVYALVREGHSKNVVINPLVNIISFDLSNSKNLLDIISVRGFDVFYHFAWLGSAGSMRADYNVQLDNVKYSIELMKISKELQCDKFVNAGSVMEKEVYYATLSQGNKMGLGYIYGAAKLVANSILNSIAVKENINFINTLITNVYGIGEVSPRFINTTLRKIINQEPLTFTSGIQNYDFIYIEDAVYAFYLIGLKGKVFKNYVIGSSKAQPLKKFVIELLSVLNVDENNVVFGNVPFTGINMPLIEFNENDLEKDTGFIPNVEFGEGVICTYEWLKKELKNDK